MIGRKAPVSPDSALAGDIFDQLCAANTLKSVLHHHRHLCEVLKIKPTNCPQFYPRLKAKINNWRAQAVWNKLDKRAGLKCYNRGKACSQMKVSEASTTSSPSRTRSRCRISVPIECLLKTKFLRIFKIRRMYIYQVAYQNVAGNILN